MASTKFFTRGPPELIVQVMSLCDSLGDIKALTTTCRHVHSVWLSHAPLVIKTVAPRTITAFWEALLTARAIATAQTAQQTGEIPAVDIRSLDLDVHTRKPSPSELVAVVNLDHLIQIVEMKYLHLDHPEDLSWHWQRWPWDRQPQPPEGAPEAPGGMGQWKNRFYTAMYMSLLLGALLAGAYIQPFVTPTELSPPPSLPAEGGIPPAPRRASRRRREILAKLSESLEKGGDCLLTPREIEYLVHFPAYDLNDQFARWEEAFGTVAEWFVSSTLEKLRRGLSLTERPPTRSLKGPRRPNDPNFRSFPISTPAPEPAHGRSLFSWFTQGSEAEAEGILWKAMQVLHASEFMLRCFTNHDGLDGLWREQNDDLPAFGGEERKVSVVLFGIFQAEVITMPKRTSDALECLLPAAPPRPVSQSERQGENGDKASTRLPRLDIPIVLDALYLGCDIPNHYNHDPAPPPPLQFFCFMLRKHFNLKFWDNTFKVWREGDQQYREFRYRTTIFANGFDDVPERAWMYCTNGTEILVEYKPPLMSYEWQYSNPRLYEYEFEA